MTDRPSSMSEIVVESVANEANVSPTELDPLYEVVDPDHLDTLFHDGRGPSSVSGRDSHRIKFAFNGYRVTVTSNRSVSVTPLGERAVHSPSETPFTGPTEETD